MKRIKIVMILSLLCAAHAFAQNGVITELSGTVELKAAGGADFIAAQRGDEIARDTIVSTGFKSSALIRVGSSVLTVRPLTRLSLAEISASSGTETINVSLQTGRVKVDVNPPAGTRTTLKVQSPVATASVRGTSFEFDTQSLEVFEGTVAFESSEGGTMLVNAGGSSEIMNNGMPADPLETGAADLMPPPYAGNDTGFQQGGTQSNKGEFIFDPQMK